MVLRQLLAPLAVCLLLFACDGSGEALRTARGQVARGDLNSARAALDGVGGSEADRLRDEIERASAHRLAVRERVDLILSRLGPETAGSTRMELKRMLDAERDPGTRELLERTLSELTDRRAEMARARDVSRDKGAAASPPEPDPAPAPAAEEPGTDRERMLAQLRADLAQALEAREWGRGLALVELLADQTGEGDEALELREELVAEARAELAALRAEAWDLERSEGPDAAVERLEREAARFPEEGPLASFHGELNDLREMAAADAAAEAELEEEAFIALSEIEVTGAPLQPEAEPEELAQMAAERRAAGDLRTARTLLLAAAQREWPGPRREDWIGEARDLKGLLALRSELADARRADPEGFAEMGVTAMDEEAWMTGSGRMPWEAVPIERLVLAVRMADLSPVAWRGLRLEQLGSGESRQVESALVGLAWAVDAGELEERDAANLVSRMRAASGRREYVLEGGEWKPASAVAARERSAAETRLEGALVYADAAGRDAALAALVDELGPERAGRALHVRMSTALKALRAGRGVEQLERVAARREELDLLRAKALALIFDEDTYFYPYNPPEPPRTASDYARAQRDVDRAVGEVRRVWEERRPVRTSAAFRDAVEELRWGLVQLDDLGLDDALPPDVPPWLPSLPLELEQIGLAEFAWSSREAGQLAEGRLVRARNERVWGAAKGGVPGLAEDAIPAVSEQEQVRVTNDYRAMLGRRVLAWNARVQVAAQGHSNYMANTGHFGHFEDDPERHSVVDRLKLVDYLQGGSENVARNGGGARGAHDGWLQSSGHHRNILAPGHTEMASALAGSYWTQNFGRGESFMEELGQ